MVIGQTTNDISTRSTGQPFSSGVVWIVLALAGMTLAFFWDGLASLLVAWQRPEYSYGPLVPFITGYIALRELHKAPGDGQQ